MIVQQQNKSILAGALETRKQTIAPDKINQATYLLRDKIYTDKIKAAIFETVCNAIDEHRKYKVERPVEILLTKDNLFVRDFGRGLCDKDAMRIFFQYFESTKSHSDEAIGGFGIGAKAPGAYSNYYTVVSYYNGKATTFVSTANGFDSECSKLYVEDTAPENTGIMVSIPVNASDRNAFFNHLNDLYIIAGWSEDKDIIAAHSINEGNMVGAVDMDKLLSDEKIYTDTLIRQRDFIESEPIPSFRKLRKFCETTNEQFAKYGFCTVKTGTKRGYYAHEESTVLYCKNTIMVFECPNTFSSQYFNNPRAMVYDGDQCYKLPSGFSANSDDIIKAVEQYFHQVNTGNISWNDISSSIFYKNVIFIVKRGQLTISPSRETVEDTPLLKSAIVNAYKVFVHRLARYINEASDRINELNAPFAIRYKDLCSGISVLDKGGPFIANAIGWRLDWDDVSADIRTKAYEFEDYKVALHSRALRIADVSTKYGTLDGQSRVSTRGFTHYSLLNLRNREVPRVFLIMPEGRPVAPLLNVIDGYLKYAEKAGIKILYPVKDKYNERRDYQFVVVKHEFKDDFLSAIEFFNENAPGKIKFIDGIDYINVADFVEHIDVPERKTSERKKRSKDDQSVKASVYYRYDPTPNVVIRPEDYHKFRFTTAREYDKIHGRFGGTRRIWEDYRPFMDVPYIAVVSSSDKAYVQRRGGEMVSDYDLKAAIGAYINASKLVCLPASICRIIDLLGLNNTLKLEELFGCKFISSGHKLADDYRVVSKSRELETAILKTISQADAHILYQINSYLLTATRDIFLNSSNVAGSPTFLIKDQIEAVQESLKPIVVNFFTKLFTNLTYNY